MKDDPVINLATRFGPILKAAFPNEHSVTRFDVANALAEAALSAQQAAGEAVAVDPDDMSWFTIAIDKRGNTVILDYAPGWEPHSIEFYWEDTFEIDPPKHLPVGAYRWAGFKIGSWGEDDSINIVDGQFTPLYAAPQPEAPAEVQQGVASYRHKKRGTIYEVVGEATLQCAANPALDEQPLVIYRGEDGMLWARGVTEFHDGRFEALATPQQGQEVEAEVVATCERLAARMGGRYVLRANDASDPQSAAAPADRDILHLARILEEWDMKPWPNDHTGHSYEDIARDALTRLALPAAASVEAGERAQIVGWLRDLAENHERPFGLVEDYGSRWALKHAADAIERGEHMAAKGKDQA